MHPARACHVLVNNLADTMRCLCRIKPQSLPDTLFKRHLRCRDVDRQPSFGKAVGFYQPLHHVGIGHRGLGAPLGKGCGAGFRPSAFRPDLQTAQPVHMCDRAAACTDFDHFDHWDTHRHARSLDEPRCPRDFKFSGALRTELVDQAQLGGGAPHVETQHLSLIGFSGNARGQNGPTGGTRFHQPDR